MLKFLRSLAVFAGFAFACPALAQDHSFPTPGNASVGAAVNMCWDGSAAIPCVAYQYKNITTDATFAAIKSGPGILHTICVNTPAATEAIQVYDALTATGLTIAKITSFASLPGCFTYDASFTIGLTIVTATAAGDITVSWQ